MVKNFIHPVENLCKTPWKSTCKTRANLCEKPHTTHLPVQNYLFPLPFPYFPTTFLTTAPPLFQTNLFHYSTAPTTITNILYINNNNRKDPYEN